jgi:hypothetical protein
MEMTMTTQQLSDAVMKVFADEMHRHEEAICQAERQHGRASGNYVTVRDEAMQAIGTLRQLQAKVKAALAG